MALADFPKPTSAELKQAARERVWVRQNYGGQVQVLPTLGGYSMIRGAGADQLGGMSMDDLLAIAQGGYGDGGGGGGYGGGGGGGGYETAWGSTEAAARLQQQYALEQLVKQQTFEAAETEKQRKWEEAQKLEELKAERQRIFSEMLGTDPVRAALFAMGIGGQILPEGERFASLPPLQGAQQYAQQATSALQNYLGGQQGTGNIALGASGLTGMPNVEKAATAYSAGYGAGERPVGDIGAARTMLTSGYGVGATPGAGAPGMSREEMIRRIAAVTPQGVL